MMAIPAHALMEMSKIGLTMKVASNGQSDVTGFQSLVQQDPIISSKRRVDLKAQQDHPQTSNPDPM
ncbi:hypothetical protein BFJ63_vAg11537 [Fusarium oxysporum f. sp. narcissi]|uniref:Uncharacterized protein n=2 Tax=Fusarium oxysporum TaxID=5507 RepID=A0A4Q2VJ24_FUSOX|nr:hypothetical protein BFJ65_g11650 [Fusarium oxysporum f. sp. cepae]RKK56119.1 hypothetical protein BFJ66_g3737 [Fusarium oxysporum f. sp. cepae]RKK60055.1 hypothetical protein BFJ67_g2388 [Fusarium oxysporum f. sp. cepae]RYC85567.1 hypothetical protein BFJ63_vAg11537 [Fusarium oxysporum f. sp. narcissi]